MNRIVLIAAVAGLAVACGDQVWGQIPQYAAGPQTGAGGPTLKRSTRPVVAPSTGLLGSGVGANSAVGYQYFTRVIPQVTTARALGTLGRSVNRLQSGSSYGSAGALSLAQQQLLMQQQGGASIGLGPTGHSTGSLSHTRYFNTTAQGGTILSAGGGAAGASAGFGSAGVSSGSPLRR